MSSVAVVVLDTLRKDTFDRHFDWVDGKRFENAWSTSHWTVPAHASLFTGEPASKTGCHARSPHLRYEGRTLAERLSEAGYRTRGFSANRHVSPYFDFDRGFDEFKCVGAARADDESIPGLSGRFEGSAYKRPAQVANVLGGFLTGRFDVRKTVLRAIEKAYNNHPLVPFGTPGAGRAVSYVRTREFDDDEFLFLNLMDTHAPYKPPLRYQSTLYTREDIQADGMPTFEGDPSNEDHLERSYEDCARYLSDTVQKLLAALEAFDYVILLSDHGESFGEDGVWGHPLGLHPELTRIPLVICGPRAEGTTVETPVDLLDVYATVADAAGLNVETPGRSLLRDIEPRPCVTEYHGLAYERRLEKLREIGVPEARITEYDDPRYGVALAPDYYGYESVNGFTESGSADLDSPHELLGEVKADRPAVREDDLELDSNVKSQLDQLGYI